MLTRRAARTREGAERAPRFQNGLNGVLAAPSDDVVGGKHPDQPTLLKLNGMP